MEPAIERLSEESTRKHFPEFLVDHPKDAGQRIEWAGFQVGLDNKLTPHELRKAFDWNLPRRTASRAYAFAAPIAEEWLPEAIKRPLRRRLYPSLALQEVFDQEINRISQFPPQQHGSTSILGHEFNFPNGPSCAYQLKSIFGQEVYKFKTLNPHPRIIDGGANIGLASIYFARNFPGAKILAFEADPTITAFLSTNLQSFQVGNVEIHQSALWIDDQGVAFVPDGADAGRVVREEGVGIQRIPSVRLRNLLAESTELLKLDVEGAEVDLLLDCADQLQNVERVFVEYHSDFGKPQRLPELINVFEKSGFRLHIHSPFPAVQPLMHRPVKCGYDLLLEIFAFRA